MVLIMSFTRLMLSTMTNITNTSSGVTNAAAQAPNLRFSFSITAEVEPGIPLTQRDHERLEFIPITGGQVSGEISGDVVAGGGDWCLSRNDDAFNVEARYGIRTDKGAYIDVVNVGVLRHVDGEHGGPEAMRYFLTTPIFRTSDLDLLWLTRSVFVGQAQVQAHATVIDVYEVVIENNTHASGEAH